MSTWSQNDDCKQTFEWVPLRSVCASVTIFISKATLQCASYKTHTFGSWLIANDPTSRSMFPLCVLGKWEWSFQVSATGFCRISLTRNVILRSVRNKELVALHSIAQCMCDDLHRRLICIFSVVNLDAKWRWINWKSIAYWLPQSPQLWSCPWIGALRDRRSNSHCDCVEKRITSALIVVGHGIEMQFAVETQRQLNIFRMVCGMGLQCEAVLRCEFVHVTRAR